MPCVSVSDDVVVNALPIVVVIPDPLIVIGELKLTPLVVMVPVPLNVIVFDADHVVVDDKVKLPLTVNVPVEVKVQVAPVVVSDLQTGEPDRVIVGLPELLSTITGVIDEGMP